MDVISLAVYCITTLVSVCCPAGSSFNISTVTHNLESGSKSHSTERLKVLFSQRIKINFFSLCKISAHL